MTNNKVSRNAIAGGLVVLALVLGGVVVGMNLRGGQIEIIDVKSDEVDDTSRSVVGDPGQRSDEEIVAETQPVPTADVDPVDVDAGDVPQAPIVTADSGDGEPSEEADSALSADEQAPSQRVAAIATDSVSYGCPGDSTGSPSSSNPTCLASTDTTVAATSNTTYRCPAGSAARGSGVQVVCTASSVIRDLVEPIANTSQSCPADSHPVPSLRDLACGRDTQTTVTTSGTSARTYTCPPGATQTGDGPSVTCTTSMWSSESLDSIATHTYHCPGGANGIGSGQSLICTTRSGDTAPTLRRTRFTCPEAATSATPPCQRVYQQSVDVDPVTAFTYSCPSGERSTGSGADLQCHRLVVETQAVDVIEDTSYSCPANATRAETSSSVPECFADRTVETNVESVSIESFSCPLGATVTGSGATMTCTTSSGEQIAALSTTTVVYRCPAGSTGSPTATNPWCTRIG